MGTADTEGDLWGQSAQDWASIQEPMSRPLWGAMRAAGEETIRAAVHEAVEPFLLDDGSIEIKPNVFTYVVATV